MLVSNSINSNILDFMLHGLIISTARGGVSLPLLQHPAALLTFQLSNLSHQSEQKTRVSTHTEYESTSSITTNLRSSNSLSTPQSASIQPFASIPHRTRIFFGPHVFFFQIFFFFFTYVTTGKNPPHHPSHSHPSPRTPSYSTPQRSTRRPRSRRMLAL